MGLSMTAIIEWTEDAQAASRPEPARWHEGNLQGVLFETGEAYPFFAAIAGVRDPSNRPAAIPPRGVPGHLSGPARRHFEDFGSEISGWLHLSEIDRCMQQRGVDVSMVEFEVEVILQFMRMLVGRLSDSHVRMVFDIS